MIFYFEILPIGPLRLAMRLGGGLMLFSAILYAFFGLPTWAPAPEQVSFRDVLVFAFHLAGIILFGLSFYRDSDDWRKVYAQKAAEVARQADERLAAMQEELAEMRRRIEYKEKV